ncbi:hypothetical protein [Demequina sp.]|uniref:hypothetical protein n=1 Tax=Demequina sp. TaxID=2050685 RepID=UPI003A8B24C5
MHQLLVRGARLSRQRLVAARQRDHHEHRRGASDDRGDQVLQLKVILETIAESLEERGEP